MTKLLGFIVTREKHGTSPQIVWAGITEESRIIHKQWILDNVSSLNYDGVTSFQDVESDVIIDSVGYYKDNKDRIIRIDKVCSNRDAFGYIQKRLKSGKLKDKTIVHYWLNGQAFNSDNQLIASFESNQLICVEDHNQ